ncbi:MAG: TolC family protein [Phycisphaerales bacterium]|nr:TolC family protein [Phycisphaerales bacterium]
MNAPRRAPGTRSVLALAGLAAGVAGVLTGCSSSPLADHRERDLRRTVVESIRTELDDAQLRPGSREISRQPEALPIDPKFYPELEAMAGPSSRDFGAVDYGPDLMGVEARPVGISLERAIRSAVANNLEVQFARLAPAISEADVVAAEAAFDWTLFSNLNWNNLDQVSPSSSFGSNAGLNQRQSVQGQTGVRRQLESGGQFAVQQELIYTDFETRGQTFTPDPATQATLSFQFDQPLLRGFGSDVALAQVRVNRNVERDAVARLRVQLLQTVNQTEATYWELVRAQHDLAILQKLLERGLKTRDQLQTRLDAGLDVPPSQLADAVARVERRKSDVRQARDAVRDAGDRIKVLMNDPDFPVGSEVMLLPLDQGVDEPMAFSLVDALTTAVTRRPEVDQAIVSMDNTSIRETVAANQRLPQLNLQVQTRFQGMDDALGAVSSEFDGNFVDYVVGLAFEQAIGNRGPEAEYTRRRLEREQAVISYRNTVQQIVRDVKASLRAVTSNYEIVAQRRQARIAAAESLRTLEVENEKIRDRSSERLELEFNRQEALANAERTEMQAISEFNSSVAQLYAAMGTALERNNITLVAPTAGEALRRRHSADWYASWAGGGTEHPGGAPAAEPPADGQGVETPAAESPEAAQDTQAPAPEAPAPEAPGDSEAPAGEPGPDDARGGHPSGG